MGQTRPEPTEVRFTIELAGRDDVWPELTAEEARAMLALGFRFSIFDESAGEFRISIPYAVLRSFERDVLTFIQDVG
ncbi:hypothetical protein [Pelagibacterium montanilacus]|uniref:hypothetical protein n=1 Tax=Pelagibacterium montanilacus TaxID=2185280 RepID=UPI000F8DD17E|nr:hypothetical protein [Pelagibacterium montanilacus]